MASKFDSLMFRAQELHDNLDTEWADNNPAEYDTFADEIEEAYSEGEITAQEHDDLALTAFYDYFDLVYYPFLPLDD